MGKKSKVQKLNSTSDMGKNLDATSETMINGSNHCAPELKKNKNTYVRRSGRLQSIISKPVQNQEVQEINLVDFESENEDEPNVERENDDQARNGPTSFPKTLDETIDDLVKAVKELKSTKIETLHFQIETLTSENRELARNLEVALGKLEVYENFNESTRTIEISNLVKAVEALVRPISNAGQFYSAGGDGGGSSGADVAEKKSTPKKRGHGQL